MVSHQGCFGLLTSHGCGRVYTRLLRCPLARAVAAVVVVLGASPPNRRRVPKDVIRSSASLLSPGHGESLSWKLREEFDEEVK